MSLEKRKSSLSSTDQDSAEKRKRIMEENKISDKRQIENISTVITSEQTVSLPFLPNSMSCSQTRIKSSTFNHTWKIEQFKCFSNLVKTMESSPFPETGQYRIQMKVLAPTNYCSLTYNVCFYILTSNTFNGLCTTTVMLPSGDVVSSKSISGSISNNTLLIKIPEHKLESALDYTDTLTIHIKFEFFCNAVNKTTCLNIPPSANKVSDVTEDVTYFEESSFDEFLNK